MAEYIERYAAVNALIDVENRYNRGRDRKNIPAETLYKDLCKAEIYIGKLPSADVAPVVHGRWEDVSLRFAQVKEKCTVCGGIVYAHGYKYCPNCGAKMDLEG